MTWANAAFAGTAPEASLILAFEYKGGWKDVQGAATMVTLTHLLGGGSSFSSGGPGKGMHSRLYTRVLNQARAVSCGYSPRDNAPAVNKPAMHIALCALCALNHVGLHQSVQTLGACFACSCSSRVWLGPGPCCLWQ